MNIDIIYLNEKLSSLVYNLLIDTGTAKQRLFSNLSLLHRAFSLSFPLELEEEKKKIINQLTKYPEVKMGEEIIKTSYQNTLLKIKNSTASDIISDIYTIHLQVKSLRNDKLKK